MEDPIDLSPPAINHYILPKEKDGVPFINPMTGQWIQPITSRSAGPSNWYNSDTRKNFVHPKKVSLRELRVQVSLTFLVLQVDADVLQPSNKGKGREEPRAVTAGEDLIDRSSLETKLSSSSNQPQPPKLFSLPDEDAATSYITTARDCPSSCINPFSDQYKSPESLDLDTPQTSTSHNETSNSPPKILKSHNRILFAEDIAAALTLQLERVDPLPQRGHIHDLSPSNNPPNQLEIDYLTAQRLQAELDNEVRQQEIYARQIQQQFSADLAHDLAEARRLASQWEAQDETTQQEANFWQQRWRQEDQQVGAQADFAKEMLRAEEEEREESIRRDMAAAMAAQMQWEAEAQKLEAQIRQAAEEAERREEEERRRFAAEMAERERRAQLERERIAKEEAERRAEEERRRRMTECVSCRETGERTAMCVLGCGHGYCGGCVTGSLPYILPLYHRFPPSLFPLKVKEQNLTWSEIQKQ
jgi:hypothetical protein